MPTDQVSLVAHCRAGKVKEGDVVLSVEGDTATCENVNLLIEAAGTSFDLDVTRYLKADGAQAVEIGAAPGTKSGTHTETAALEAAAAASTASAEAAAAAAAAEAAEAASAAQFGLTQQAGVPDGWNLVTGLDGNPMCVRCRTLSIYTRNRAMLCDDAAPPCR